MLEVHLSDGRTLRFDLNDERQARAWFEQAREGKMQASITGMTITKRGLRISLPKPRDFRDVFMFAERAEPDDARRIRGSDRMLCHAGEVQVHVVAHDDHHAARVELSREGKLVFNPISTRSA